MERSGQVVEPEWTFQFNVYQRTYHLQARIPDPSGLKHLLNRMDIDQLELCGVTAETAPRLSDKRT